ncbi:MAG: hypothetical protein DRO14_05660, partial [Thermoprotei archaeon]
MAEEKVRKAPYNVLLIRRKTRRKVTTEERIRLHISDSRAVELLERTKVKIIESQTLILPSPSFIRVNVRVLTEGLEPKVYKLSSTIIRQPVSVTLCEIARQQRISLSSNISPNFFTGYPVRSSLRLKRTFLRGLSFRKAHVNSLLLSKRRVYLKKPSFIHARVSKAKVDIGKILAWGMSAMDRFLLEVDLGEVIFGRPLEEIGLAGSRYVGEPFIIITIGDLWYVIAELCKEIYREARGGFPKPHIISSHEELKDLISLGEKLNDRILILTEDAVEFLKKDDGRRLRSKIIMEMFSQGLGFLVLITKDKEGAKELSRLVSSKEYIYKPKVLVALGEGLNNPRKARALFSLIQQLWGIELPLEGPLKMTLSMLLAHLERRYRDFIDTNLRFNQYLYKVKPHKAEPGKESEDHLALKTFIVKYLVEKLKIPLASVETEHQIGSLIADVFVKDRGLAIEIETLYETGAAPLLKVRDSVLKYKDSEVRKIWVVLRNTMA